MILFKQFVYQPSHQYLLVGDETVEGKAGKSTHGINRFYSSIAQRVINSVSFLAISLVDVTTEKSWTIALQQLIKKQKSVEIKPTESSETLNSNEPKGKKGNPKAQKIKLKQNPQACHTNN